jgi:hypothetical protein
MKGLGPPRPNVKNLIAYKAVSHPFLIHAMDEENKSMRRLLLIQAENVTTIQCSIELVSILTTKSILSIYQHGTTPNIQNISMKL